MAKQLKEIFVTDTNLRLEDNIVKGGVLPNKFSELKRSVDVTGETIVEGPLYGSKLTIAAGPLEVTGATFIPGEIYVNQDTATDAIFRKAVGSASSIVSRAPKCNLTFCSDINAKSVTLTNAFVAGSIYADEITLDNCVVIGGVFATQSLSMKDCIAGTFISPEVNLDGNIYLLLPSMFSLNSVKYTKNTHMYSLALADLGALYRGVPEAPESGVIELNLEADTLKTTLTEGEQQRTVHSYSVIGKVLAADLVDTDKFQNHFLLTAAALGPQLLRTYDLGLDKDGKPSLLSVEKIRAFLFDILHGKIKPKKMDGSFSLEKFAKD